MDTFVSLYLLIEFTAPAVCLFVCLLLSFSLSFFVYLFILSLSLERVAALFGSAGAAAAAAACWLKLANSGYLAS